MEPHTAGKEGQHVYTRIRNENRRCTPTPIIVVVFAGMPRPGKEKEPVEERSCRRGRRRFGRLDGGLAASRTRLQRDRIRSAPANGRTCPEQQDIQQWPHYG